LGIFDFLKGKSTPPPGGAPVDKKVAGPARVAADKRAQTYDRIEAIQALVEMKTPDAAAALLQRFRFSIDPSITDQEEKELSFQGIIAAGRAEVGKLPKDDKEREKVLDAAQARKDLVIDAVRAFSSKSEQLTWPLKVLRELLDDEEYVAEVTELLERFDTEYSRNVEPKVQLIMALEEVVADEAREAVLPFLEDVNETVKFHAVATTFAQDSVASVPALVKVLANEESIRVKNKIAEGLLQRGWVVPPELCDSAREALRDTEDYSLDKAGKVLKR
jgi:HEAT repeat protein